MKHSFYATLSVNIEVSDKDFELMMQTCCNHYDNTVQDLVRVGGFLYGAKNRREWNVDSKDIDFTERQLGLILKAFEMNNSDQAKNICKNLWSIVNSLHETHTEVNANLNSMLINS